MGKLNTVIAFFTGAAVGGAAVWYITKERYAQLAEEEINSVKEAYSHRGEKKEKADAALRRYQGESEEEPKTPVVTTKVTEKESISEYAKRVQNGAPMEYSKTVVPPKVMESEKPSHPVTSGDVPYVISPEEFDELEGYTPISLTYFADGLLADETVLLSMMWKRSLVMHWIISASTRKTQSSLETTQNDATMKF